MNKYRINSSRISHSDNKKERRISGVITFIISGFILAFILLYKTTFTFITPPTYININFETADLGANFGTDEVGLGEEEPIDQNVQKGDGGELLPEENSQNSSSSSSSAQEENKGYLSDPVSKEDVSAPSKKVETNKKSIPTTKSISNTTHNKGTIAKKSNTKAKPNAAGVGSGTTGGNPKGNEAVGNLFKGKGSSTTSTGEGQGGKPGQNQGVETGGSGSGGEGIGTGRKLISFIPGTMGRGGSVPPHKCTGAGLVIFTYTVDKNGQIISAGRKSGSSDPCLVNTGVDWIKKYVKADIGTKSISGSYRINF